MQQQQHSSTRRDRFARTTRTVVDRGRLAGVKVLKLLYIVYLRNQSCSLFYSTTPVAFSNTTFNKNVYFNTHAPVSALQFPTPSSSCHTFDCWQASKPQRDSDSVLASPEFDPADVADYDFSKLMSSSPALQRGFKPIDQNAAGPRAMKMKMKHRLLRRHEAVEEVIDGVKLLQAVRK